MSDDVRKCQIRSDEYQVISENCQEGVPDINPTVSDVSLIVSDKL